MHLRHSRFIQSDGEAEGIYTAKLSIAQECGSKHLFPLNQKWKGYASKKPKLYKIKMQFYKP